MSSNKFLYLQLISCLMFIVIIFIMRSSMASTYQVYIGWVPGYVSEYNNAKSYIMDSSGEIITRFGGRNAAGGILGTGVQNSPMSYYPAPDKMLVTWLSFYDGEFWQAHIDLPEKQIENALKEKIQGIFVTKPYTKVPRYSQLVVNVGLEGKVYIYLGGADIKLIGQYQAKKIDMDWESHIKETWSSPPAQPISKQQYVKNVQISQQDTLKKAEQFNEKIFDRVNWQLTLNTPNQLIAYSAKMMNGEDQTILKDDQSIILHAIPELLICDVKTTNAVNRYRISLDQSIFNFYYKNFNIDKLVTFNLEFKNLDEAQLYLQQEDKKIAFDDLVIEEITR